MTTLRGTGRLLHVLVRTRPWPLLLAPLAIMGLVWSTAAAVAGLYPTEAQRLTYAHTIGASALSKALNGRAYDLTSIGGITAFELGFYALHVFPFVVVALSIAMTRSEEDAGRVELLTAHRLGRHAPLAAGALATTLSLSLATVLSGAALAAYVPRSQAMAHATALGATLLLYAALGLVCAEAAQTSRVAMSLAALVMAPAAILRGASDVRSWSRAWLNPLGWLTEFRPYATTPPTWPLVATLVTAAGLAVVAALLRTVRDQGAGLFADRTGRAEASPSLGTFAGLAWRLQGRGAVAWTGAAAAFCGGIGVLAPDMRDIVVGNPALAAVLGTGDVATETGVTRLLLSFAITLGALIAAAQGVLMISRVAVDETAGRIGLLAATRRPKLTVAGSAVIACAVASMTTLAASGFAVGAAAAVTMHDSSFVAEGVRAAAAQAPAVAVILAVAVLACAATPRAVHLTWLVVAWDSVVALLGSTLRLPRWARDLSPLHHVGRVPSEAASPRVSVVLLSLAVALAAVAVHRWRNRDLVAG